MEKSRVFTYSLKFALRLVDTTTGKEVTDYGIRILMDGVAERFVTKGGVLIFQELEKRAFQMEVCTPAYEPVSMPVDLDALDKRLPMIELHLIPSDRHPSRMEMLTMTGICPGIEELCAVRVEDNVCMIRDFDPRKRQMKIFNPHRLALDRVFYALVNPDENVFESFRIQHLDDDQIAKIDHVIETSFKNYFPVTPIVFGLVQPDGSYCLRVRDDWENAQWLVRWTSEGKTHFRVFDLRGEKELPVEGEEGSVLA